MRKIIMLLLVVISNSGFGQGHYIGLKGGMNWTNVNSNDFLVDSDYRKGFNSGLNYEYRLNTKYSMGLNVLYFQKGFTDDIVFTDAAGNPTGERATVVFNYDYLSFPMTGGFSIGNKVSGFINLGLVPSILIVAKTTEPEIEGFADERTINVTDRVSKFDFGGIIEIGANYNFGNKFLIFTSLDYQQSFLTITNADYFSAFKIKHYGMTMSIGLKYLLKKE